MFLIMWATPWAWENYNIYPLLVRLPIVKTGLLNNLELYIWRCLWEVLFDLKYINIHSWIILSACSSLNLIHRSDRPVFSNSCHLFITQGSSVRLSAPLLACGKHFTFGSIESISGNQANWQYSLLLRPQSIKNWYKDVPLFLNPVLWPKHSRSLMKWTQNGFLTAVGSWCQPFPR